MLLSFNQLSGSLSTEFGLLSNLCKFQCRHGHAGGSGRRLTCFTAHVDLTPLLNTAAIDLSDNFLTADIPSELGMLAYLGTFCIIAFGYHGILVATT
jgi:hypothetical protein